MKIIKTACSVCDEITECIAVGDEYICYACACDIVGSFEEVEDDES